MEKRCPYCGTKCRKEGNVWICPNHGRVMQEVEKEKEGDRIYIG